MWVFSRFASFWPLQPVYYHCEMVHLHGNTIICVNIFQFWWIHSLLPNSLAPLQYKRPKVPSSSGRVTPRSRASSVLFREQSGQKDPWKSLRNNLVKFKTVACKTELNSSRQKEWIHSSTESISISWQSSATGVPPQHAILNCYLKDKWMKPWAPGTLWSPSRVHPGTTTL